MFPDEQKNSTTVKDVLDFFFIGNSINFAFRDFETGDKFVAEYNGVEWSGAFGMWACLKRAYDRGKPVLSGKYLMNLTEDDVRELFQSANGRQIPLLEERHRILRSVGEQLVNHYDGRFHNLLTEAHPVLFDVENGIINKITQNFPSFDDTHSLSIRDSVFPVHFYKRAQLALGMAYGRYNGSEISILENPCEFTVFPDYNLPNVLRHMDVISYDDRLSQLIHDGAVLQGGSREDIELRIATVVSADQLVTKLNQHRTRSISCLEMDFKLFSIRDDVQAPVHKTRTTDY
ncbi:queuosine salvage family protein [Haloplanus rallus]|uniref:queuosine salvage family protein n=1 Tax=Haloplanus rallus TaxID=1816183 RepID=UPI0012FD7C3C|nr:queuosine salvage family protein [Haloplanus rallus]